METKINKMKKHISYPKIVQFRNVVSNINREITYTGLDEEGKAIYDPSIEKPTLTFKGTVKLHGTNASVCFNSREGFLLLLFLWAFYLITRPSFSTNLTFFFHLSCFKLIF